MPGEISARVLRVDLTTGAIDIEQRDEAFCRAYFGGASMGTYYLLQDLRPGTDAFDPSNILAFFVSILTGAPVPGLSRVSAVARSPLTDGIGQSEVGGFLAAEMRFAGFEGIVITGRSERPVYLWLHDGEAELRPADHLWGLTTADVETAIWAELGDDKVQIAEIGPAGEQQARIASIMHMANRAFGRTGLGAVMGSKNLKALAVRGRANRKVPVADPKGLSALARWGAQEVKSDPDIAAFQRDGTAGGVESQHFAGGLPTFNFNAGQFDGYETITGQVMTDTILKHNDTCFACSVRCKRVVETEWQGRPVKPVHGGPEYETIGTLGSYCGVDDLGAIALGNQLCNEYGLDTISAGATIAWAMECFENGLLTADEIGFPAPFGDAGAMVRLLEMMGRGDGLGKVLADGSRRAATALGRGEDFLITSRGLEAPAHMPQVKRSLGLIYAVNSFGADHQVSEHDPYVEDGASDFHFGRISQLGFPERLPHLSLGPEKVRYALRSQWFYSFMTAASMCHLALGPVWPLFGPRETLDIVRLITGWSDFDMDELMEIGERRVVMQRLFNAREGLDRHSETLPPKFFRPLTGTGPSAGSHLTPEELETAKDEYYRQAGWDVATGEPLPGTIERLGLAAFV